MSKHLYWKPTVLIEATETLLLMVF
jgi:hypothetical protein